MEFSNTKCSNILIGKKIISKPEVFFCSKKAIKTYRKSNHTKFNAMMEFYLFLEDDKVHEQ